MEYAYAAFDWTAALGGYFWCLYSIAFRWHTVTHKYGRIELYFWVLYINIVAVMLSALGVGLTAAIDRALHLTQ